MCVHKMRNEFSLKYHDIECVQLMMNNLTLPEGILLKSSVENIIAYLPRVNIVRDLNFFSFCNIA